MALSGWSASLLACLCLCLGAEAARILVAAPLPSASHFRALEPLLQALAARGHQLTVISHFPQHPPRPNYTDISLERALEAGQHPAPFLPMKEGNILWEMQNWVELWGKMAGYCREAYSNRQVRELLASGAQFDLALVEVFAGDCMAGLANRFDAPLVGFVSGMALPWVYDRMGNPDHPAYMESFFLPMVAPFDFWERTANTFIYLFMRLVSWWMSERVIDAIERDALGRLAPPTSQVVFNTSLMLLNSHFSLNQPVPLVPAMIQVGGIHIQEPKALPKDLHEFMESSEQGVIYISMGTLLRPDSLPRPQVEGILRAFASLPQKVLWKAEHTSLPPLPPNVRTSPWLPQYDILNHPRTVAFITLGGLLGVQEAVCAGVPLLVVPVLADQLRNAASMRRRGVAETLSVPHLTQHNLRAALDRLINDTSYQKRVKELSVIFRDRPRPPLEEAVYWVEYVLRHQGAPHLRSAALDLAWYQYLLIDVAVVILAALVLALASTYVILRWVVRLSLGGRATERKKIKKN